MNTSTDEAIPKYYLIANAVIEDIRSGKLKPGMKVPSENEIIREYGVSNTTARKALQEIELAGWAKRVKGRGTFVLQRDVIRSANRILSFTRNMLEAGYQPSARIIDISTTDGFSLILNGRQYSMPGPLFRIQRLRFADEIPMLLETRYVPKQLFPDITDHDLTGSIYEIYETVYGVQLKEEVIQISWTEITSPEQRELFGAQESVPAFLIEGATFSGNGIPLEMEHSLYRGDKYSFTITATK